MLPYIYGIPSDDRGWDSFVFAHANDHLEIIQAIKKKRSISLPVRVLYPVNATDRDAFSIWEELHQDSHTDMNGVLGIAGTDLTGADLTKPNQRQSWLFYNFIEHQNARAVLGI